MKDYHGTEMKPGDVHVCADEAAEFLRALGHSGRLLILCHLATGEKSVNALETLVGIRQAAVSQQLARLRQEGLVRNRRVGKSILYSLSDDRARQTVDLMQRLFTQ